ncbi:MAG: T9SS type A sorting domain-containing protein [Candidatus Kryptoniota bacterium]
MLSATSGYEIYITTSTADTTLANRASVPAAASVNKSDRYVSVGAAATDTTYTLADTLLLKNTIYFWKVRVKGGTWAYPYSYFKIGAPVYTMSNANAWIQFNHDTLGAITGVKYVQGSGQEILDTAYNATNLYGIGGNGAQKDTVISWYTSANTDTNIFTYQNATKYGMTGSKVMTVSRGTNGITANIALTLETGKAVNIATAWKPGGDVSGSGIDNVLLVKNSPVKTPLTYPSSAAWFGADSITLSAMYDNRYNEYFGIKSSSLVAVTDTQKTGMLKQVLSFNNTTGSNATYTFGFAVRNSRLNYFDTWANDRPMIISKPAAGDSLTSTSKKIVWESFGASPSSISFSSDGGTTFGNSATIVTDTSSIDSVSYTMPSGPPRNTCVVELSTSKGDVAQSGVFKLVAPYAAITSPKTGDSLTIGQHEIKWVNQVGDILTNAAFSLDSGKTWSGAISLSTADTTNDSVSFNFYGAKNVSNYAAVKVYGSTDTIVSSFFKVEKRYATVTTPASGASLSIGKSYVVWTNLTGSAVTYVDCSLDSGKTWVGPDTLSPVSTATKDSVLYDFLGGKTSSSNTAVRIRTTAGADTAQSGFFTLGNGGAVFSIPTVIGNPGAAVVVSIRAKDYMSGDSIKSFDVDMTFDTTYAHFDSLNYAPLLLGNNWITTMDSSNYKTTTANYVRLAGFMYQGKGIKDSAIAELFFTIKNKQSIIGSTSSLVLKNSVLAASGNGAYSLDVSGSTNGTLKIYSSISGSLHYLHEDTIAASYNISGDNLIVYRDFADTLNNTSFDVASGQFDLTNREPNDSITFCPSASIYTTAGWNSITVADARLAFLDFYDTLSARAKIAADVNGDGVVNATDAQAIMEISVDSTYLKGIGLSNWIFIDSTSLVGFEHASDSMTAWYTGQQHSDSYTLTSQRTHQDFFGVLRGNVTFSYGSTQDVNTAKTMKNPMERTNSSSPILFSTNANINVRPGDTVWIPLNINPGDTVIGGFNASMQVDPKILNYTGQFKMGQTMPQNKNWFTAAKSDAKGNLRVASTDFSTVITPIVNNGTALLFEFVVSKNVQLGTSSSIAIQTQSVVDTKMRKIASLTESGQVQISSMGSAVATHYELSQNYPNPFNPSTTIQFAVPMDSKVDIVIYNILGQKVATLVSGTITAGYHDIVWNATNYSSGVYFSVMKGSSLSTGESFKMVKKLMLVK